MDRLVTCPLPLGVVNHYFAEGRKHALPEALVFDRIADRLLAVVEDLRGYSRDQGLKLWILDGVRPFALQDRLFHDAAEALRARGYSLDQAYSQAAKYVSPPNDILAPAHVAGGAVDVLLGDSRGPYEFFAPYDSFDEHQESAYYLLHPPSTPSEQREFHARELLRRVMEQHGFVQHPHEYCHFEYGTIWWGRRHGKQPLYNDFVAMSRRL